nr:MAG TPA: hypothetical protein [Caudoviricetes sp.]
MNFKTMKLKDAFNWLLKQWSIHADGDGANAHRIATELMAGFASPETVRLANGHFIKDNELGLRIPNLWDVPPGKYATTWQWTDSPETLSDKDGSIITLEIYGEHKDRLQAKLTHKATGAVYIKDKYGNNGNNPNGWTRVERSIKLWEGEAKEFGTTITTSDSLGKFKLLRVYFDMSGERIAYITPNAQYHTTSTFSCVNLFDSESGDMQITEMVLNNNGGSTLTVLGNRGTLHRFNGADEKMDLPITLKKIEGIM